MAEIYCLDSSSETDGIAEFSSDFPGQSFQKFKIKNGENAITWLLVLKLIPPQIIGHLSLRISKPTWSTFIVKWGASS